MSNFKTKHYFIAAIAVVFLLYLAFGSDEDKTINNRTTSSSVINSTKFISGLSPVDIYLNMEKQGFTTNKNITAEYGNTWTNKKSFAGIEYTVETYSSNIKNVEMVRATAMVDLMQKKIIATQQFFIYLMSLPYSNSQPDKAANWIKENFNNDKASIVIGGAKITIFAPSEALRMVNIECPQ